MRGSRTLFEGASLTIYKGNKVGITGRNGCGKSSLFSALLHTLQPEQGEISYPKDLRIATVSQEVSDEDISAVDYVVRGDAQVSELMAQKQQALEANDGERIAAIEDQLGIAGAWDIRSRAGALLFGLGFKLEELDRKITEFSGGWRMRLNLAQALIVRSDLLLLDEPTNHLDLDAILFLEDFLRSYPATLLCISHDRDFMDSFATHILHFDHGQLVLYRGNYSEFERQRAERMKAQEALRKKQEQTLAHMQAFVDRFRYKATKAKQAQSLLKAIDRIALTALTVQESPFTFEFFEPERTPDIVLQATGLCCGYGTQKVLSDVELMVLSGERIGLLGANGQGKSTLIKTLCRVIKPLSGKVGWGRDIKIGYFAQHEMDTLQAGQSALWHLQQLDPEAPQKDLRNFLGSFAFDDRALSKVSDLSGGERARLALALIVYQRPNLLLLDEPTNHLDMQMREALYVALAKYDGALMVVSHDRHLLEMTTNRLYLVEDGTFREFDGDLGDYQAYILSKRRLQKPVRGGAPAPRHSSQARREQKQSDAAFRQSLRPLKLEIERIEKRMSEAQDEMGRIDGLLSSAGGGGDMQELLIKRAQFAKDNSALEELYLEKLQELEDLQKEYEIAKL